MEILQDLWKEILGGSATFVGLLIFIFKNKVKGFLIGFVAKFICKLIDKHIPDEKLKTWSIGAGKAATKFMSDKVGGESWNMLEDKLQHKLKLAGTDFQTGLDSDDK